MNPVDASNAASAAKAVKNMDHVPGPSTVRKSLTLKSLAMALAKAQAEMKNPSKDKQNPHFKSWYADLATVRDTVVPVLAKHGLSVVQLPCELDDQPALTTLLMHDSGEWVETTIKLRPSKLDPQGVGSAETYHRRYCLQAIAGVAAEDDDDGHAASQPARQHHHQSPPQATPNPGAKPNPLRQQVARLASAFAACADIDAYAAAETEMHRIWADLDAGDRSRLTGISGEAFDRVGGAAALAGRSA